MKLHLDAGTAAGIALPWRPMIERILSAWDGLFAPRAASPEGTPAEAAAALRAYAERFRHSDPGFASDLWAAADRHERQHA